MPNWCDCKLKVSGQMELVEEFDRTFCAGGTYSFANLYPPPIEVRLSSLYNELLMAPEYRRRQDEMVRDLFLKNVTEMYERGELDWYTYIQTMLDPSPYENQSDPIWYHWQKDNWGVKWDIGEAIGEIDIEERGAGPGRGCIVYWFQTPWGPPYAWLYKVMADWPGLTIKLTYYEPDVGFGGVIGSDGTDYSVCRGPKLDSIAEEMGYEVPQDDEEDQEGGCDCE